MRWDSVFEGETLDALSARLGVPGCMLLRANRLFSPAWLLPGREISVPDADFCARDQGICPVMALYLPAQGERTVCHTVCDGEDARSIARMYGLPTRLVLLAAGCGGGCPVKDEDAGTTAESASGAGASALPGQTNRTGWRPGLRMTLTLPPENMAVHTVLPGETARELSAGMGERSFRRLNGLWGPLLPGMQVLVCRTE